MAQRCSSTKTASVTATANMSAGRSNTKTCLSMRQQLELVKVLENGVPIREVAAQYKLHVSTVWRIKRRAIKIHRLAEQEGFKEKKKIRSAKHNVLEARLYAWFLEQKSDKITNKMLREKAIEINKEIGGSSDFRGSEGWLWRFKQRYHIFYLTNQSENDIPEKPAAKMFVRNLKRIIRERGIEPDSLYNMQETGLAWRLLPERLVVNAGDKEVDERNRKDKVTVGFCANATGTHKLPMLFINEHDSPRELKHCKNHLPVVYKSQEKAQLDGDIFVDWFENCFKTSVNKHQSETRKYGPVLLVVENSKAHYLPKESLRDGRFTVVYLKSDAMSIRQPMNEGVIGTVKKKFRCKMLQRTFSFDSVDRFYADYDLKDCMDILHDTWTAVTSSSIKKSWSEILRRISDVDSRFRTSDSVETKDCVVEDGTRMITGGDLTVDEVENWLSICTNIDDSIGQGNDRNEDSLRTCSDKDSCFDKTAIERTFEQMILWFKREPDFLQMQVQCLKSYYDKLK